MERLETDKRTLNPNAEEGRATVEVFALKMFKKADDSDRQGIHNTTVAKLFYVSSILMQTTKQFGDLSEDIVEKLKYAKWKAAEITKSIKSGEQVQSGGFGEQTVGEETTQEEDHFKPLQVQDPFQMNPLKQPQKQIEQVDPFQQFQKNDFDPFENKSQKFDIDPFETKKEVKKPDIDPFETKKSEIKKSQEIKTTFQIQKIETNTQSDHQIPKDIPVENIIKAQTMAKYVISALQFPDIPTAIKYLEEALNLLKQTK